MEQQKVLWIVFSVALFALVVVVVGFIWFLPPDDDPSLDTSEAQTAAADMESRGYDPIEWVRQTSDVPGISEVEGDTENEILLVYGESEENSPAVAEKIVPVAEVSETVMEIRVADAAELPTQGTPVGEEPQQREPTVVQTAPTTAPKVVPQPRTVSVTHYWIQAGSFTARSRAENTQQLLAEKGWTSRIISRDVDGRTYFRVRIGPYEAEAEAEKFLEWLRGIDTFEGSYISQMYSSTTVN